jgi:hypothetical protein
MQSIFKYLKIFSETYKLLHPALVCLAQGNWPAAYNDAELAGHRIRAVLIKSHRNDRSSMSVPRGRLARSIFLSLTVLQAHNKKRQSLCKMRSGFVIDPNHIGAWYHVRLQTRDCVHLPVFHGPALSFIGVGDRSMEKSAPRSLPEQVFFPWKGEWPRRLLKVLFTSRVFEGMGEDYFLSRNLPDRLFTSPGFKGIIPRYPHKSPPL